jgi:chemotaxis protein histidine kinase CheA
MDVTDEVRLKRRLESEEREHRRSMESLFQIIHVDPAMLKEFVTDTEAEFESVNELMRQEGSSGSEILETLYQSMHAVKGNAILLGLKEFGLKVHDYETVVRDTIKAGHEWRDLLSLTLGLADLSAELESLKGLIGEILSFQLQTEKAGLTETSLFQAGFEKMVAKESQRLGVPASCEFSGLGKKGVPDRHRRLLKDILAQLIRNSFAHGFEGPDERQAKGKGRKGRISLAAEWAEGSYLLRYRDDGRGLDPERIRRKALAMPEFAEAAAGMDDSGLARLIFKPGFSTSEGSDLGSGRGIGMALVMRRITEAGGRLSLKSGKGKYLEFAIRLPVPEAETGPWA